MLFSSFIVLLLLYLYALSYLLLLFVDLSYLLLYFCTCEYYIVIIPPPCFSTANISGFGGVRKTSMRP
jgi:hypothetical protein